MRLEKKHYSYEEICEKFLDFTNVSSFDYQNIVYSMVEYVRQKNGLDDVVVTFNYDGKGKFDAVARGTQLIQFNKEILSKNPENPRELLDTYICIHHEFAHILDRRQNETLNSDKKREFISEKSNAINELAKFKPDKENIYKSLDFAIYYTNRSEVYARRRALEESKILVKDLYELAQTKYACDKYYVDLRMTEHKEEFLKLNKKTFNNVMANKFAKNFVRYRNHLELCEEENFEYYESIKQLHLEEAKNDFFELSDRLLDPNFIDLDMEKYDKKTLSNILQIGEFYDDNLAHKFYDYFEKEKNFLYCWVLSQIKGFKLSVEQEQKVSEAILVGSKKQEKTENNEFNL